MWDHKRRSDCRLCFSKQLSLLWKMPDVAPVDRFRHPGDPAQEKYPLALYQCMNCGHIQLLDVVNPRILFGNYIYRSRTSPDLLGHFEEYVSSLVSLVQTNGLKIGSILEIGSNDGLFLDILRREFCCQTVGVDPSEAINVDCRKAGHDVFDGFFLEKKPDLHSKYHEFDLIIANNVLSHMDDLRPTFEGITGLLAKNGIFVFEVSYALETFKNCVFDYIYHEHLAYHSIRPLIHLFGEIGLELIEASIVKTKGGSLRVTAQKLGGKLPMQVELLERLLELEEPLYEPIGRFIHDKSRSFVLAINHLVDLASVDKPPAIFGACATSNILLEFLREQEVHVSLMVDNEPSRQGLFHSCYEIEVVSPEVALSRGVDSILIGAWRHADIIRANNRDFFARVSEISLPKEFLL